MGEFPGKQVNSILNDLKAIPLGLQEASRYCAVRGHPKEKTSS